MEEANLEGMEMVPPPPMVVDGVMTIRPAIAIPSKQMATLREDTTMDTEGPVAIALETITMVHPEVGEMTPTNITPIVDLGITTAEALTIMAAEVPVAMVAGAQMIMEAEAMEITETLVMAVTEGMTTMAGEIRAHGGKALTACQNLNGTWPP